MNAVIVFDITGPEGGKWTLDMTRTVDGSRPGHRRGVTPKMTLTASDKSNT